VAAFSFVATGEESTRHELRPIFQLALSHLHEEKMSFCTRSHGILYVHIYSVSLLSWEFSMDHGDHACSLDIDGVGLIFFYYYYFIIVEFYWWGWIDWWGGGIRTRAGISFVTLVVDWHYVRTSIDFDAYKRSSQHPEILKILNLILGFFIIFSQNS
jgi:hypothetical protein